MRLMLKLSGMLCIFLACCMVGFEMERRLKQRCLFLREAKETLLLLEQEMTWHRTPLTEALKNAAKSCCTPFASMLLCCADQVEERQGQSFAEIWSRSAAQKIPAGLLTDAEYQTLLDTGMALCNADTVLQKTHLQKQEQRFDGLCRSALEEWKEKGSLYRRLSAAAGLVLVIILL